MSDETQALLNELRAIDDREDDILDALLRHGAALEESERRMNLVTAGDLRVLRDGLAGLETVIDKLQADVARAEALAVPPPPASVTQPAPNGQSAGPVATASAPAAAPPPDERDPRQDPLPPLGFEQLAARISEHDAETARLREVLRDRLIALGAISDDATAPSSSSVPSMPAPSGTPVPPSDTPRPSPAAGQPARLPRTFRLTAPPMTGADVKRLQRDLNHRFERWGIAIRVHENGRFDKSTRHAARQILLGLGVDPADYKHGITPRLWTIIRNPSRRTAEQLKRAKARRPWLQRLRARAADGLRDRAGSTSEAPRSQAGSPAAAIRAHGGRYEEHIVREAERHGLPVSLVCAVIECESGFRNVFGRDSVRNPIKSPPRGVLEVTEARYKLYLKHRNAGRGNQGTGPMQLTNPGLQDRADKLGGCWKPSVNIRVGCEFLAGNIRRLGSTRQGVRAYNGSGPTAERYATKVLERERVWRQRLAQAQREKPKRRPRSSRREGRNDAPRTFKLTKPPMSGDDVQRFQHDLNARFEAWKIDIRISEDGEYGAATRQAARQILLGLGLTPADYEHGVTPQLRSKIRNPSQRTPAEVARAKQRGDYLAKLRKRMRSRRALRLRAYAEAKRMHDLKVRETHGKNRGRLVDEIIEANQGVLGEPWCGDFLAWCYRKAGSKAVNRSWASVKLVGALAGVKKTKDPLRGDLVRYLQGDGHIGLFVCWCDSRGREVPRRQATHIRTIEGNTSAAGTLASDQSGATGGVYIKVRPRSVASDYLRITR